MGKRGRRREREQREREREQRSIEQRSIEQRHRDKAGLLQRLYGGATEVPPVHGGGGTRSELADPRVAVSGEREARRKLYEEQAKREARRKLYEEQAKRLAARMDPGEITTPRGGMVFPGFPLFMAGDPNEEVVQMEEDEQKVAVTREDYDAARAVLDALPPGYYVKCASCKRFLKGGTFRTRGGGRPRCEKCVEEGR